MPRRRRGPSLIRCQAGFETEPTMSIDTQQSLEKALQLHQTGQFPLAEAYYRHVLQHDPVNTDALHLLGLLAYQTGRSSAAVELIKRAIAMNPSVAQYHCNMGNALR